MTVLKSAFMASALLIAGLHAAAAADLTAQMRRATATGPGDVIGTVTVSEAGKGRRVQAGCEGG